MKILVTGGAGFIASHIADRLLEEGHEVHIIDSMIGGFERNIPDNAVFHKIDIRDDEVHNLWEKEGFEVMYHHAAQMDVRKSVADPKYDADVNVIGFLNLMEAGRPNGLKKVILASTGGAIYGEPEYTPQDENHPIQPLSPYGITKLVSEKYLSFYEHTHNIDWIALRYANVFGPRQNAHGDAGVVAIFTERMLRDQPAQINGDGKQTRDYVYVKDVVKANLKSLTYNKNGIFNVGTGIETDVNRLFDILQKLTNTSIKKQHAEAKPGEQQRSVVGTSKIEKEMGWTPEYTLEEGLKETVEWFKNKK